MILIKKIFYLILCLFLLSNFVTAQDVDLNLEDPENIDLLMEELDSEVGESLETAQEENMNLDSVGGLEQEIKEMNFDEKELSEQQTQKGDDLDSLMEDLGEIEFTLPEADKDLIDQAENKEQSENELDKVQTSVVPGKTQKNNKVKIIKQSDDISTKEAKLIFDIGKLEKDLLEMAKNMQGKIPNDEWNEIAGQSASGTYEVVTGDWLWKISKKIFGSGFYYSKIWALNPFITNPHEIEPGMILSFSTGSDNSLPSLDLKKARQKLFKEQKVLSEFQKWGDDTKPEWIEEREKLKDDGVYIQYSSGDTKEDLKIIGQQGLIKDYEVYEPPKVDFDIGIPQDEFDESGFDKNAKVSFNFKEGFYLNTFISDNIVQDYGKVDSAIEEKSIFTKHDKIYVRFDQKIDVIVGDKFSIYTTGGKKTHKNSDREGYQYTITASIETIQKHDGLWECKIIESSGTVARGDRITVYTPKIERITKTFNARLIEAVVMSSFKSLQLYASFGDVVYLDRGRADGVEVGNVFEVYGFKDRATDKFITTNPTYKNGELTVITVTENFSTALVTQSRRDFVIGDIAITKTKESAARTAKLRNQLSSSSAAKMSTNAVEELDVELNLDDLNDSLLDKADKIQFTEDELAEIERQEKEKSLLSENEKDLRALERLEGELETAEKMLNEARLDEDKLLENQDLNQVENNFALEQQESLDELEENFGKRYLDEDLNDKENPYGLTEFDIEEIDELLNAQEETE